MPANLSPEYHEAEERYRSAQTPEEKMEALETMLSAIPKHKGTEKMQADIKRRISQLRKEKKSSGGKRVHHDPYNIHREGAGQVVLVGPPNTGKSSILARLTHAKVEVAPFPYATHHPAVGMMAFEDIQIQLVDTAPLTRDFQEPWVFRVARNADVVAVVVNLAGEISPLQLRTTLDVMREQNIHLAGRSYEGSFVDGAFFRRAVVVANQLDGKDAELNLEFLLEEVGDEFPVAACAVEAGLGTDRLGRVLFDSLRVLRVYSKPPGKEPEMHTPFVLPLGATVQEMAREVHQDFVHNLAYARIWGPSATHEGQMVHRDHPLTDGDVVELHLK